MAIGGYITGATQGTIYVRAEYPLAVHRLNMAIAQAKDYGLLARHPRPRLQLRHRNGRGGRRFRLWRGNRPHRLPGRARRPAAATPPFPAEKACGLPDRHQQRRNLVQHRPIIAKGPAWFAEMGSNKSAGTKVISLVGKVRNTGLVEMPLARPEPVHLQRRRRRHARPCGQGGADRWSFGRLHPPGHVRYPGGLRTLGKLGSIMGSGGMVVMDDDNCMVDVARYFIEFTRSESCGKCTPCRVGLDKALRTLTRITKAKAARRTWPNWTNWAR